MKEINAFYYHDIERILTIELENVNNRFDELLESNNLNETKIKQASAERITIKRIMNLLKNEMES